MEQDRRYAIFYAPSEDPLWEFACSWLGWDPARGQACAPPNIDGLPAPVAGLTERPRRYGFHATLKAPFALAPGRSPEELHEAARTLASGIAPRTIREGLELQGIGGFLALLPRGDVSEVNRLAETIVRELDPFRAPLTDADRERRGADRLSPHLRALLERWGYPYVMDAFRFHLTLTGLLEDETLEQTREALAPHVEPLAAGPLTIGSICLFGEADDGLFYLRHRYPLGG